MPANNVHTRALFTAIAKLADELGDSGSEIFALAQLGQNVSDELIEAGK